MSELYKYLEGIVTERYFTKNTSCTIHDVFKMFSNGVLEDAKRNIKKGKFSKKTLNTIINTHNDTQLIDIRSLYLQDELDRVSKHLVLSNDVENFSNCDALISCERIDMICLPFSNNFIQISKDDFCFIREYDNNVYTGTYVFKFENMKEFEGCPFSIKSKYGIYVIEFADENLSIENKQYFPKVIATMLHMLSKLSYKLHYIYTTDSDNKSSRIYTPDNKKGKKPIYIYVSKNQTKTIRYYEKTYQNLRQLKTWLVRGHWRRLQDPTKFGKNPQGNYVVEGFTWVKPSQKGNKNLQVEQNTYVTI